jgi:hypothetical protein
VRREREWVCWSYIVQIVYRTEEPVARPIGLELVGMSCRFAVVLNLLLLQRLLLAITTMIWHLGLGERGCAIEWFGRSRLGRTSAACCQIRRWQTKISPLDLNLIMD